MSVWMSKIVEKNRIIILQTDDLLKITKELNGERPIPPLDQSIDVLGDIESFDIEVQIIFEYFEEATTEEIYEGVTDTRYIWNAHSIKSIQEHTKEEMGLEITRFPCRKGYPSVIWG